jgi:hypothetical protein
MAGRGGDTIALHRKGSKANSTEESLLPGAHRASSATGESRHATLMWEVVISQGHRARDIRDETDIRRVVYSLGMITFVAPRPISCRR